MTDRLQLLLDMRHVSDAAAATTNQKYLSSLSAAIDVVFKTLSLAQVRTINADASEDIILRILPAATLNTLLTKWDPRVEGSALTEPEKRDHLVALSAGRLNPYEPALLKLSLFRELDARDAERQLKKLFSVSKTTDLSKLRKSWDPVGKTVVERVVLVETLLDLGVGRREVTKKPPPAPRAKSKKKTG
jgi:hypothetical protein